MKATICQDMLWSNIRTSDPQRAFFSQLHVRGLHVEGVGTVFCTQIFCGFQRYYMLQGLPRQAQDSDENSRALKVVMFGAGCFDAREWMPQHRHRHRSAT
jgi:hypothetical protein